MAEPRRIGVYGGTFDPIHLAHVEVAKAARDEANLDLVLFVVSARPPHKKDETAATPEQRLAMVEAAVAEEPSFESCRIEIDREGPSYTADTLDALRAQYPGGKFYLIVGEDSLMDMPKWRHPDRILERADLLVVPRPGIHSEPPAVLAGHFKMLPFKEHEISSTEIRRRLATGESTVDLLPAGVRDVIDREGLYGTEVSDPARG